MRDPERVAKLTEDVEAFEREWHAVNDTISEKHWPRDEYTDLMHKLHQIERKISGHKELIRFYSK